MTADNSAIAKELVRLAGLATSQRNYDTTITVSDAETADKLLRSAMGAPLHLDFSKYDTMGKARPDDFIIVNVVDSCSWLGYFKNIRNGTSFSLRLLFPKLSLNETESLVTIDEAFSKTVVSPWNQLYGSWREQKIQVDVSRMDSTFSVFHSLLTSEPDFDIVFEDRVIYKVLASWQFFMKLVRSVSACKTLGLDHSLVLTSYQELLLFLSASTDKSFVDFSVDFLEHFSSHWAAVLAYLQKQVAGEISKKSVVAGATASAEANGALPKPSEDLTTSLTRRINEIIPLLDPEAVNLVENNFRLWLAEVGRSGGTSLSDSGIKRQAWLTTVANFPFKATADYHSVSLQDAMDSFNKSHYGMNDVKRALAEMLALKIHGVSFSEVICLVGPPGTGKTTIARSLAKSLNVPMRAIALGGIHDESTIRGISSFYSGSSNGRIIDAMKSAAVKNPIILLDEVDKMSMGRGSPAAALLELLDPEQNAKFVDQYLGFPVDLSSVFWITTANDLGGIPYELRNRMHMIDVPGYSREEQLSILSDYLINKYKENWKLQNVTIDPLAYNFFISDRTSGVRNMEHDLQRVLKSFLLDKELNNFNGDTISASYVAKILKRREAAREPIGFGR